MAPVAPDKSPQKSYISSAVDSINPWAAKKSLEAESPGVEEDKNAKARAAAAAADAKIASEEHGISHLHGQSFCTYPPDCPPLKVQWFHAVDVAKRKPQLEARNKLKPAAPNTKNPAQAKKFSAFSPSDSNTIENHYQKLLQITEARAAQVSGDGRPAAQPSQDSRKYSAVLKKEAETRVPVNEDFLFDVDIQERELLPAYWLGPVYEVRRGTWFYQEGASLRACEENLAAQLEEGYLKLKPWLHTTLPGSASRSRTATPKTSSEDLSAAAGGQSPSSEEKTNRLTKTIGLSRGQTQPVKQLQTYRLFGAYMNSVVTFQDANTAWLSSDSMLSWVTSSMYERFAGGGYMSGLKLIRGYHQPRKTKEKDDKACKFSKQNVPGLDERQQKLLNRRSAPPSTKASDVGREQERQPQSDDEETHESRIQRQLSSFLDGEDMNASDTEEQQRRLEEEEIQDDYNAQAGEKQGRDIEHLVLVTHGIGQLLSLRVESVNFVHDVNVLRKTMKSVYANSADLKALNSEFGDGPGNCRAQVLPVCWRHRLDFPRKRKKKAEHDLGDIDEEEEEYPSLEDITIEGMAFARSLISDLALDVLLYQSSYREEIARITLEECNRIYRHFRERNPEFRGKVHLVGHSLGSAILFDIVCRQRERRAPNDDRNPLRFWPSQAGQRDKARESDLQLDFEVADFYCLGSPIGLFQMLKGRTIGARHGACTPIQSSLTGTGTGEDVLIPAVMSSHTGSSTAASQQGSAASCPKVQQLFNIFHPSDPISYRLEPLISPAMTSLKPQSLPYTKKGIFSAVAPQGLSGIGSKVGQSVSGLWSSFSAGIANNLLNRTLGLTNEEVARMTAATARSVQQDSSSAAGNNISSGGVISDTCRMSEKSDERKRQLADSSAIGSHVSASGNDPTLLDDELETLYSRFKGRAEVAKEGAGEKAKLDDGKARKLQVEESKVRALNRNGRVDFSIQEGALDFNPVNTIASHMCYWADEDVNHFILSQLLSNKSKKNREEVIVEGS